MSDSSTPGPKSYNLPRRYPVQARAAGPDTPPPPGPDAPSGEVTRQNPTLAEAGAEYADQPRRPGAPAGAGAPPPAYPPPMPAGPPPAAPRGRNSRALILVGAAVVVIAAIVIGLVVGLSGGDDSDGGPPTDEMAAAKTASLVFGALNAHDADMLRTLSCTNGTAALGPLRAALATISGAHATTGEVVSEQVATSTGSMVVAGQNGAAPQTFGFRLVLHRDGDDWCFADLIRTGAPAGTSPASVSTPAHTSAPTSVPPSSAPPGGGVALPPSPTAQSSALCRAVNSQPPLAQLLDGPAVTPSMPEEYLVPRAGQNTAVCSARFTATQGHTAGTVAYIAEYAGLAASQYAAQLKTVGWQQLAGRSPAAFRNNFDTTVTLVQEGSTLVMVVDRGR